MLNFEQLEVHDPASVYDENLEASNAAIDLRNAAWDVRKKACKKLGKLGAAAMPFLPQLRELKQTDDDYEVSKAARIALQELQAAGIREHRTVESSLQQSRQSLTREALKADSPRQDRPHRRVVVTQGNYDYLPPSIGKRNPEHAKTKNSAFGSFVANSGRVRPVECWKASEVAMGPPERPLAQSQTENLDGEDFLGEFGDMDLKNPRVQRLVQQLEEKGLIPSGSTKQNPMISEAVQGLDSQGLRSDQAESFDFDRLIDPEDVSVRKLACYDLAFMTATDAEIFVRRLADVIKTAVDSQDRIIAGASLQHYQKLRATITHLDSKPLSKLRREAEQFADADVVDGAMDDESNNRMALLTLILQSLEYEEFDPEKLISDVWST